MVKIVKQMTLPSNLPKAAKKAIGDLLVNEING